MFTPAGIDVYLRKAPASPASSSVGDDTGRRSALLGKIVAAVRGNGDGGVAKMAASGFEVPGIV